MSTLELIQNKIIDQKALVQILNLLRFKSKKIVFTNGCFDIVHRGHIEYLAKASDFGDIVMIGLNTDHSIKSIKGNLRPLVDEISRALLLASLHFVDYVILFDEPTPYNLINIIQPDFLIKGNDYKENEIVGYDIIKAKGGKIVTIELTEGFSTTALIEKIKKS